MRDLENCPVCENQREQRIILRRRVHHAGGALDCEFAQCGDCDHVFLNPQPAPEELDRFYDNEYHVFKDEPKSPEWILNLLSERLHGDKLNHAHLLRGGRYLDVGCGLGDMVAAMQAAGMDAIGVDPSPIAVAVGRKHGRDLHQGLLHELQFSSASYDSITMYHSLEHDPVPVTTLIECGRLLKPHGILMVAVPNFEALAHERFMSEWSHLDPPYHLQHFCKRSLTLAGERAGLDLRAMQTESFVEHMESEYAGWARRHLLFPRQLSLKLGFFRPLARRLHSKSVALDRGDALVAHFARKNI